MLNFNANPQMRIDAAQLSGQGEVSKTILPMRPTSPAPTVDSNFRRVFQTTQEMKDEFGKFLKTIFYQLDEKKLFALMEKLLANPSLTDEDVYKELLKQIHTTKKSFPILFKIRALSVLKNGLGKQIAKLMNGFRKEAFHDYMEIYDRRYINTIRKAAGLAFKGNVIAVCDNKTINFEDRVQAGSILSSFPYKQFEPLNDADCQDPLLSQEKTYKPISDNVKDNSVDMIDCLGGLHHVPPARLDAFVDSMHKKLRPGGVVFLREHDIADQTGSRKLSKENLKALTSVVHTVFNAAGGLKWENEQVEIREFKSLKEWTQLMERHGFKRITKEGLILKDDPTENALIAFVKAPTSIDGLRKTISYRNDCHRAKEGTRATWIEWGNVRFSKQYAEYIQDHHAYAFDFVGHLRQHWKHFFFFIKESLKDKDLCLKDWVFSDNMAMNLFILTAASLQCGISSLTNLPEVMMARWKHGKNWRNVCNLTALEKFEARSEKEYSDFIEHTPFYMYDYIGRMKGMWKTVWNSNDSAGVKFFSAISATFASTGLLVKAAACAPIRSFYTAEANLEPDTIKILIKDSHDELNGIIDQWEKEKNAEYNKNHKIEVVHATSDGYKLVSLPRYRPFTKIMNDLSVTRHLEILEIGSQKEISIDLMVKKDQSSPQVDGSRIVYELDKLQDEDHRRYVTYQVNVSALKQFQQSVGTNEIVYIHE